MTCTEQSQDSQQSPDYQSQLKELLNDPTWHPDFDAGNPLSMAQLLQETGGTSQMFDGWFFKSKDYTQALSRQIWKAAQPSIQWEKHLSKGRLGYHANLQNVVTIIRKHRLFAGVLAFDEFRQRATVLIRPPWDQTNADWQIRDFSDIDALGLLQWLQGPAMGEFALPTLTNDVVRQAVDLVAHRNTIHPVRDWLTSLQWDDQDRMTTWISKYLGAKDTPFVRAVARAFLIAMVARVYCPGCKVDTVLTLIGKQGLTKSQVLQIIGGIWFKDTAFEMAGKDSFVQLQGSWIYELAELSGLTRADVERVKAFLSSGVDSYRPPYGRSTVEIRRQTVFVATTNSREFLKDATGNRRFWPIEVGQIDLPGLAAARSQLFAEAVAAYRAGEQWWLNQEIEDAAHEVQEKYTAIDPWEPTIISLLIGQQSTTVTDLLAKIEPDVARWNTRASTRIGLILNRLDWKHRRLRVNGGRERRYYPPDVAVQPGPTSLPGGWTAETVEGQGLVNPVNLVQPTFLKRPLENIAIDSDDFIQGAYIGNSGGHGGHGGPQADKSTSSGRDRRLT